VGALYKEVILRSTLTKLECIAWPTPLVKLLHLITMRLSGDNGAKAIVFSYLHAPSSYPISHSAILDP
jgi:hypothetical protein